MVMGDNRKFISALIVPNFETLQRWAEEEGVGLSNDASAVCRNEAVKEWVAEEVEAVNERFEKHERIKEFRLVPEEWSPENDLLTPSMKLKRRNIIDRYEEMVKDIYGTRDEAYADD
jgi:long-chain acyl-CoA synthetase